MLKTNIVEGLISTYLGFQDESLALFGFESNCLTSILLTETKPLTA